MFGIPPITDGIITLRPLQAGDETFMYDAIHESLNELKPWMSWAHDGYQRHEAQDWVTVSQARWNDGSYYGFAILDAQSRYFLGSCSLSHIHPLYYFCNLGYWIRTTQRGHGYAGHAMRLAARFAFEYLHLLRAEIVIDIDNVASQKAADKAGAHREGVLLNRLVIHGDIRDAVMYSLLPSDFGRAARL